MRFVEYMQENGHRELAVWTDTETGLKAFIAIHDLTLGPALGGTRLTRTQSWTCCVSRAP